MSKKLLSLALSLVMVLALLPAAQAADKPTSGTCGAGLTWTFSGRTLTISGTGAMEDYTAGYLAPWKRGRDSTKSDDDFFGISGGVQRIVVEEGVTYIGNHAFDGAWSLTSVSLPGTLTGIGDEAFQYCAKLTDIRLPEGLTSIGRRAFSGCENLTALSLPDSLTTMGPSVFNRCKKLADISLPSGLTEVGYGIFDECKSLRSVDLPDGMTEIGMAFFEGCTNLTHVTIPDSVTEIGMDAFSGCESLTSLDLPDRMTKIDRAFLGTGLTSITFPAGVTRVEGFTFQQSKNLTTVVLSEGVTEIDIHAFDECESLASITLPKSLTTIAATAFSGCYALKDIYYGGSAEDWAKVERNEAYNQVLRSATVHYGSDVPSGQPSQPEVPDTPETPDIPDTPETEQPSSWAQADVSTAVTANLVPAELQAKYTQAITRAEFCALADSLYTAVKGTAAPVDSSVAFTDTTDPAVLRMASAKVVNGVGGGKFNPEGQLTREQAAAMLSRLAEAVGKPLTGQTATFADMSSVSSYATGPVGQMQATGVMGGVGNNTFAPKNPYTREQSIVTILRLFNIVK